MDKISYVEYKNILSIKSQLLSLLVSNDDKLKYVLAEKYIKDNDGLKDIFSYSVDYILNNEEAFFYLDTKLIDYTLYIVGELKGIDKKNSKVLNSMIPRLNSIKYMDMDLKLSRIMNCIEYESNIRNMDLDLELYVNSILYDTYISLYLDNGYLQVYEKDMILSSINSLLYLYPEIFKDKVVQERLEELLDMISKNTIFNVGLKKYLNYTRQGYKKVVG